MKNYILSIVEKTTGAVSLTQPSYAELRNGREICEGNGLICTSEQAADALISLAYEFRGNKVRKAIANILPKIFAIADEKRILFVDLEKMEFLPIEKSPYFVVYNEIDGEKIKVKKLTSCQESVDY